ncbi:MAG: RHS repeat-associated core domain-containing protein [Kouleothrix sp.]|jgi:RHS repeat-associated protein|nr:RHS repeat-associated core domain-containing protein [Kouleothrix sp.]
MPAPHTQARTVGGQAYSYDANGNLLSGGRSFTWDPENRPSQIVSGTVTETYAYDADGERISRTSAGTTTIYLQGSWEETTTGAVKRYYLLDQEVVAVRDSAAGNAVSYLHGDHLGSLSVASDAAANGTPQTFTPWGTIKRGGISVTSLNFTGQRLDSGTGLLYYHARYYDPVLGRFLSPDSLIPNARDPQDFNRYSYAKNNPLRYTDPTGHCVWDACVLEAAAVVIAISEGGAMALGTAAIGAGTAASYAAAGGGTAYTTDAAGAIIPDTASAASDQPDAGAEEEQAPSGPTEPYNRKKHYGNTPTKADREAVGGSPDHNPPLVKPGVLQICASARGVVG